MRPAVFQRLVPVLCGILAGPMLLPAMIAEAQPADPQKVLPAEELREQAEALAAETPAEPADAGSGQTYRLAYKFGTNQKVAYDVTHKMTITTQKDHTSETTTNESKTRKHFRVVSVDEEGTGLLELTIDHVEMMARFGDSEPVVFDSQSDEPPPHQFKGVQQTVGKPLARIKVSPHGEPLSVVRLQSTSSGNGGQAAGGPDQQQNDPGRSFLIEFPPKPVRIGDTWHEDIEAQVQVTRTLNRTVKLRRRYELLSVEDDLATIGVKTSVLTPVRDPKIGAQLIQRTPSGTVVFDIKQGRIVSRKLTLDNTEIGVFAGNSSMRAVSERVERLVPREKREARSED